MDAELLVIGGGPAGLATAIAARQAELSVAVAEPCDGAIDKCCGEGLLPPALAALAQLGITHSSLADHAQPFCGIGFHAAGLHPQARFAAGAVGLGVRRTELHRLLHRRAADLGVRFHASAARLLSGSAEAPVVLMDGREYRPQWVVGADGARSAVRAAAQLEEGHVASRRYALRQHFTLPAGVTPSEYVEVFWARDAQAYVTQVARQTVGVALLARHKITDFRAALRQFPAVAQRLQSAKPASRARGAVSLHHTLRRVARGRVALVGDAGGSVDAVTGDGLALAFEQALALGDALRTGDLSSYGKAHRCLTRPARVLSRTLLAAAAHPVGSATAMLLLSGVPGLFGGLLRLHTRLAPAERVGTEESAPWQTVRT